MRLLFMLLLVLPGALSAQVIDYQDELNLPYQFEHVQLTLEVEPEESTFLGVATWRMRLTAEKVDTVRFLTLRSDVKSVRFNEKIVDYAMRGDSLYIPVLDSLETGTEFKIEIVYKADPQFGIHKTENGTYWSSFLPGARSDLFPSIPHPGISVTSDIRLIVPNHWKAVGNGISSGNTLMPEEKRLYHWRTSEPVPVIDIGIVMGDLEMVSIRRNGVEFRFYYESGQDMAFNPVELMQSAAKYVEHADTLLNSSFPFESFNMVYLPDHKWEARTSGAGLSYLFSNSGDLTKQLIRDISTQYFGSRHKSARIEDGNHILLNQAWLYTKLLPDELDSAPDNWSLYPESDQPTWTFWGPDLWNEAVQTVNRNPDHIVFDTLNVQAIARLSSGLYTAADYLTTIGVTENVYYPLITADEPVNVEVYTIDYKYDESANVLTAEFTPSELYDERFIPIRIRKFADGSTTDIDLVVSSYGDRISLSATDVIDNLYILPDDPGIHYIENKPSAFWMYQLRNDSDYLKRLEAADGFGRVTDDPDIQLFLQNLIRNEPDTNVRSIMVRSFAMLTNGDSGTHQRFIELLSDTSSAIRHEAMDALRRYKTSETVRQEVYRVISTSPDIDLVNHAISVYFDIADEEEFFETGRGLLVEDQKDLLFTATILPLIVQTERGKQFAPNLMQYLEAEFPFFIRNIAFDALKEIEISPSYWEELLPVLVSDPDPRVRFLSLDFFSKIDKKISGDILSNRFYNEYDVRVLHQVQKMLQNL